jgi:hypothetical protein
MSVYIWSPEPSSVLIERDRRAQVSPLVLVTPETQGGPLNVVTNASVVKKWTYAIRTSFVFDVVIVAVAVATLDPDMAEEATPSIEKVTVLSRGYGEPVA